MSRNFKLIVAGLCFAALASASTASAQISQMRLFSPYPDDQFGGGIYQHEGFYGSIGAGFVSLSRPCDQVVGKVDGVTQFVTNVFPGANNTTTFNYMPQSSQINTSQFHAKWETATEFVVGNMIGHHGWELKGTVVSPQRVEYSGLYGGINIEDPAVVNVSTFGTNGNYYIWTGQQGAQAIQQLQPGGIYQIGRLWAIRGLNSVGQSGSSYTQTSTSTNNDDSADNYVFVPIPLTYETYSIQSKVNTCSVEAMYNYRFHPFRSGTLEALAGLRYTKFDSNFTFFGHANTMNTSDYSVTEVSILNGTVQGAGDNQGTQTTQSYQDYTRDTESVIGADLGYSDWKFEAQNHIVGPQVGLRYTLSNNRWRFMAEGKYFAGFNRQNVYGDGTFGLKAMSEQDLDMSATGGVPTYAPLNTIANTFAYSKHYNEFTNGIEGRFDAVWNWTQAIGFKVGYQMLFMNQISRAEAVNDYRVNRDGTLFGVKENKKDRNFNQLAHGVMFTVMVNR
mgnify:CR=1 FL=1